MSNQSNRVSEFFNSESEASNLLWQYVKSLSPDTITQLSKPSSHEVLQVMERNIIGLLGNLPSEQFGITISTSRESLGRLLASAMISGYFLRNAEQRMGFDMVIQATDRRSSHILDRTTSMTRFPLVAKSYQTKAQAGHKAKKKCKARELLNEAYWKIKRPK